MLYYSVNQADKYMLKFLQFIDLVALGSQPLQLNQKLSPKSSLIPSFDPFVEHLVHYLALFLHAHSHQLQQIVKHVLVLLLYYLADVHFPEFNEHVLEYFGCLHVLILDYLVDIFPQAHYLVN